MGSFGACPWESWVNRKWSRHKAIQLYHCKRSDSGVYSYRSTKMDCLGDLEGFPWGVIVRLCIKIYLLGGFKGQLKQTEKKIPKTTPRNSGNELWRPRHALEWWEGRCGGVFWGNRVGAEGLEGGRRSPGFPSGHHPFIICRGTVWVSAPLIGFNVLICKLGTVTVLEGEDNILRCNQHDAWCSVSSVHR